MRPRPRLLVALALTLASTLGAYACGDGTFPSTLPIYDPDSGPGPSQDSGPPLEDAVAADVQVTTDGGDAGPVKDGGDAGHAGDAGEGGSEADGGDGGSSLDAADGSG